MSFWQTKTFVEMTTDEWESLCDGCGKCCLHKLEDEDTGKIYFTNVACRLLDIKACRCTDYTKRTQQVPECLDIRKMTISDYHWLPATCAYRLIAEGSDLPTWHPLIAGCQSRMKATGISISGFAVPEHQSIDLEDHIIDGLN